MPNARLKAIMILFISASPLGSLIRLFMLVLEYLYEHKGNLRPEVILENINNAGDHVVGDVSAVSNNSTMSSIVKYAYEFMTPFFIPARHRHYQFHQFRVEDIPKTGVASLFHKNAHNNINDHTPRQFTPTDILRTVLHHHAGIPIGSSLSSVGSGNYKEIIFEQLNQDIEIVLPWMFAFTALIVIPFSMIVIYALLRRGDMENERQSRKIKLYTLCLEGYYMDLKEEKILRDDNNGDGDDNLSESEASYDVDEDDEDENDQSDQVQSSQSVIIIDDNHDSDDDDNTDIDIDAISEESKPEDEKENLHIKHEDKNEQTEIQQSLLSTSTARTKEKKTMDNTKITKITQNVLIAEDNVMVIMPKAGNTLEETLKREEQLLQQQQIQNQTINSNISNNKNENPFRQVSGTCAICLQPYEVGDKVVWSSFIQCPHVFHYDCITTWIQKRGNSSCPCCRRDFIDTGLCRKVKRNSRELRFGQL